MRPSSRRPLVVRTPGSTASRHRSSGSTTPGLRARARSLRRSTLAAALFAAASGPLAHAQAAPSAGATGATVGIDSAAALLCRALQPAAETVEPCERAVALQPHDLALRLRHADALAAAGDARRARRAHLEAIRIAPDSAGPYLAAAAFAAHTGRHDDAVRFYLAAAERRREDAAPSTLAGWLLLERGRAAEALPAFREGARREAMSDAPAVGAAHGAGIALQRLGRHEEAVRQLRVAVERAPGDVDAWGALARSAVALERTREAASYWERALSIDPAYFDRRDAERRRWQRVVATVGVQPAAPLAEVATTVDGPRAVGDSVVRRRASGPRMPRSPVFISNGTTGSGVAVSTVGHVLTNRHVVRSCASVRVRADGARVTNARVVAVDADDDLALLLAETSFPITAVFRSGGDPRAGEDVVAVGYPLNGLLADQVHVTTGAVNALAGLYNDAHELTVSTPVQPGNSGGPLLDASGHVVGIVVTKLNARIVAEATGDLPQNVNFAIKASVAREFLAAQGIAVASAASGTVRSHADVGDVGRRVTLLVECVKPPR